MINKPFADIDKATIDGLVADKYSEMRTLEYKEKLPEGTDKAVKEFLADVSSFSNASGGDILYGIKAERDENDKPTGKPESAVGIEGVTGDQAKLRLENMIRDGVAPRLNVQTKSVDGFPKGPVIVLRIPQSLSAPHVVKYHETSRFYSRNSAGKYQLDVGEIRSAFAASEALPERIKRFREERLANIIADEAPVALQQRPVLVIHFVPISAFLHLSDSDKITFSGEVKKIIENLGTGHSFIHNLDGYFGSMLGGDGKYQSYLQVFRNGIIEYVDCWKLSSSKEPLIIPCVAYEEEIIRDVDGYLKLMQALQIETPILIMVSILRAKGLQMSPGPRFHVPRNACIHRDSLIIPDIMIEDYGAEAEHILKPAFDRIWQACGLERSLNYDEDGNWRSYLR